ncbi:hypothetical protein G9A89_017399 [Geosiphon pyriformis]|nr:hypothetical protein G9A89_017399 [Geosiphon pyriformis]
MDFRNYNNLKNYLETLTMPENWSSMLLAYRTLKQDTIKHILFDLTYGRTAILPVNFTVETYPMQPINEKNFQETLQKRAYTILSTLEEKKHITAIHIEYSQALQKERHDNKLPPVINKFKIGNKKKTTVPVVNNAQNYHSYRRKTRSHSENRLPELLKQVLKENLLIVPIDIPPNATLQQKLLLFLNEQNNEYTFIYRYFHIEKTLYERKLELEATNITPETVQKQIHNEFKAAARPTNTCYKLRAAFRLYDLFNTCKNVLQNPILQPIKVQYIGKLTELKFQQFSDQITSIILDHYLDITDST